MIYFHCNQHSWILAVSVSISVCELYQSPLGIFAGFLRTHWQRREVCECGLSVWPLKNTVLIWNDSTLPSCNIRVKYLKSILNVINSAEKIGRPGFLASPPVSVLPALGEHALYIQHRPDSPKRLGFKILGREASFLCQCFSALFLVCCQPLVLPEHSHIGQGQMLGRGWCVLRIRIYICKWEAITENSAPSLTPFLLQGLRVCLILNAAASA